MKIAKTRRIINSKNVFIISLLVIVITILSVWFYGIGKHKTVIENSLISTSILSIAFFLFITISLYNGTKLKDTIGKITDKMTTKKTAFLKDITLSDFSGLDVADGIVGILLSIVLWIIVTFVLSYLFFALGTIIWFSILLFLAMLYWLFFRALRLIFKKSAECSGNFERSIFYGFTYTLLYNFWIYGIILLTKFY
ncbi:MULTISPECIES: hypothetical protein [Flavobacterium]|uniref:Uncharacterized protein n=1 Tax=Flavobacterium jumunjinense TaxID=998845 RepID=A0ABV5GJF2_9FLAO|nr:MULTISPECIES: hypothetical protein [Flavobacterium]